MLEFLRSLTKMKNIPRSGWISHGISLPDVESVADHTFSTCAISLLMADLEVKRGASVNVERVLRMAILHDLSESLTFDISKAYLEYLGSRGKAMKAELEASAWKHLAKQISDRELARFYSKLESEYSKGKTLESRIVHAADALDLMLQVAEYQSRGYPKLLMAALWKEASRRVAQLSIPSAKKFHAMVVEAAKRPR